MHSYCPPTSVRSVSRNRAFTLVEILIAALLVAVLAGVTMTRIVNTNQRAFDQTKEAVADLLVVFAQRNQFSRNPIALRWDEGGEQGTLRIVSLVRNEDQDDVLPTWEIEPHLPSVVFPSERVVRLLAVSADGDIAQIDEYPLAVGANLPRPTIELRLEDPQGQIHTIAMAAHELAPTISASESPLSSGRLPIDLNETGQRWEEW